jgi:hypothetical protein
MDPSIGASTGLGVGDESIFVAFFPYNFALVTLEFLYFIMLALTFISLFPQDPEILRSDGNTF